MEENVVYKLSKRFALRIVNLYKILLIRKEYTMSKQLYRSGTSIGANLAESIFAQSEADYISKLKIALKEASESKYWIELLTESNYLSEEESFSLINDVNTIIGTLVNIINKLSKK
ncbi:MAG: four helix bundle protein [Prevotella sp.]|nr:four helix bundle protein [Prevotella sp.]